MTELLPLVMRFAATAIEEALARRAAGTVYRAEDEVSRLVADLSSPSAVGLAAEGRAVIARAGIASAAERDPDAPLARVLREIGTDGAGSDLFLLLLAWAVDPRVGLLFGHVHDSLQRTRPTVGACAEILRDPVGVATALEASASLRRAGFVELDRWGPDGVLGLDPRIVTYALTGVLSPLDVSAGDVRVLRDDPGAPPSGLPARAEADVLVVRGVPGTRRTRWALAFARREGCPSLVLRLRGAEGARALVATALRDARVLGARLVVENLAADSLAVDLAEARDVSLTVILDAAARVPRPLLERRLVVHHTAVPGARVRSAIWAGLLARAADDPEIVAVAERYELTEGAIRCAALQVPRVGLEEAARMQLPGDLEGLAFPRVGVSCPSWDRLVLPDSALDSLRAICAQVRHAAKVGRDWGFASRHALGRGAKALFFGKPGTGKTLAVDIIAAELNLPILRVDLSRIVSKWIGETEQNLAKVFDQAKQSHAILFFDEADSLFAKRTAVQSSTDRYANMEVNYLLQRIDAHEGVVLLATNLKANMDDAFARRLHHVVEFPEPDARARERIWRISVPEEAPLHEDVDFAVLARRFEIPGGAIKSAVMGAAFLAAAEDAAIRQRHFATALRREYAKMDRLYLKGELDALAAAGAS